MASQLPSAEDEARADDWQPGEPGRGLRSAGEVVLQAMRPLRQLLGQAGGHCHHRQCNEGKREEQQQCRRQPARQPISEQQIA